jgi:oxepin-CoA hydrolase/3-oxo-5,6-dehydrosuberyl-CoA semialdehyde dehydrogenase
MTFTERAAILKSLARHLSGQLDEFVELSTHTGATRRDTAVDVDGGIATLAVYAGKAAKELPDATALSDGHAEPLGKGGTFVGRHILTPKLGAAVQINAFNFPVWGMLEKFAPAFLAGMPTVVKPASQTAYLAETVVRCAVESALLPDGTLSLGPDVTADDPEFALYLDQLITEMTVKAGQKCTAIVAGHPGAAGTDLGPLASLTQRDGVRRAVDQLATAARIVHGDGERVDVHGADAVRGAFLSPIVPRCEDIWARAGSSGGGIRPGEHVVARAAALGTGSLVGSIVTHDRDVARHLVAGLAPWHGRLLVLDRDDAAESTGHGIAMPQLRHGGPGRAGGAEELGGLRALTHHLQRTAVQGHRDLFVDL